jgi:hypothetical protein
MFIDVVPNRNSPPAILLRESRREGNRVVKTTLANLSMLPAESVEALRLSLRGIKLAPAEDSFAVERSRPHGHVQAVLEVMRTLKVDALLGSRPCRERDLVMAMMTQQLLTPCSKLAMTRQWRTTTLAERLGVGDANENELYAALDWLLARKQRIEQKLAKRHLDEGGRVLFDVSSSSYHGHACPLARYGYNRDGERLPSIVYGLLTDGRGIPIAVDIYPGNTGDPTTVPDQVEKLRMQFGLERVVLVGDRGMLTQTQIQALHEYPGLGWISALRSGAVRELVESGALQLSLFDTRNLAEITSDDFPGERLMACFNPLLAEDRKRTRDELLEVTQQDLERIAVQVNRRTKKPMTADEIGIAVGKVIQRRKMGKHFILTIEDGRFEYARHYENIEQEARLDGIYILRTGEPPEAISSEDTVRTYKSLGQVEQAFRCIKGAGLRIRPIHHRTEDHVKAHVFLCMLAYYVHWHMRKALSSVLFQDDALDEVRWTRDPVAKAHSSPEAKTKKQIKANQEGWPLHNFQSLMNELATQCKNTCRAGQAENAVHFELTTEPTPFQAHVHTLLATRITKDCVQ